jgi:hypothetical protein
MSGEESDFYFFHVIFGRVVCVCLTRIPIEANSMSNKQCYFFRQRTTYLLAASWTDQVANQLNSCRSRTPMPQNVLFTWRAMVKVTR